MGGDRLRTVQEQIDHADAQRIVARDVRAQHQKGDYGLCQCDRVWPCSGFVTSQRIIDYCDQKIEDLRQSVAGPTMRLPHVRPLTP